MLDFTFANQFKKDLKRMEKRHRNMDEIYEVIALIIWGDPLPEQYREHGLSGDYARFTECHVAGDILLIYRLGQNGVYFSRTGTHSDLF
jgi:mRNA interferase YafQ